MLIDGSNMGGDLGERVDLRESIDDFMLQSVEDMLSRKRELWNHFHPSKTFPGVVQIEAQSDLSFDVIQAVMASAARAGYREVSFVGVKVHH